MQRPYGKPRQIYVNSPLLTIWHCSKVDLTGVKLESWSDDLSLYLETQWLGGALDKPLELLVEATQF